MTISDTYRVLEDDERIIAGDEFKMHDLPDAYWSPVDTFVGHRVREFNTSHHARVEFRRVIVRGEVLL